MPTTFQVKFRIFSRWAVIATIWCFGVGLSSHSGAQTESDSSWARSLAERIDGAISEGYLGPEISRASDSDFLRRIFLDLVGRGPTRDESLAFITKVQEYPERRVELRNELIDDLLGRDEFSRYYAKVIEVMLTERREVIGPLEIRLFIKKWLDDRRPLNELFTEVLAADGTGQEFRAAAGFVINRKADANLVTRDIGRIFFGRDIQCAQCHDHPLVADYEQSEYFGILSFVNRTYLFEDEKRNKLPFLGEKAEGTLEFSSVFKPQDGKTLAQPVLPGTMAMDAEPDFVDTSEAYVVAPEKDRRAVPRFSRRQQMAVLATHPGNEAFNRNLANRLWANLLGKGVVHPVDMHHIDNPPTSAALLRVLADGLVASRFDLREFLRQIVRSNAYQRSALQPELESWQGPAGGMEAIDSLASSIQGKLDALQPPMTQLKAESEQANRQLQASQANVDQLQTKIDSERKLLQQYTEQKTAAAAKQNETTAKQKKHEEVLASLQTALGEADKVLKVTPDDAELVASRELLNKRLQSANDAKAPLQQSLEQLQEDVQDATRRVDDQRGRLLSLANRKLALGEFVIEARGIQRRIRRQIQAAIDQQTDYEQQLSRIASLRSWLELRSQREQARQSNNSSFLTESQDEFELQQRELLQSWQRLFAMRTVRSLSPEQMTGATFTALEMDKPVRSKALADWATQNAQNSAELENAAKRDAFVGAAIAVKMWDTVEDLMVERFSAPAGNPQDAFFATVDQALVLQNDPTYQSWLKSNDAALFSRLALIKDPKQLTEEMTWSILGRQPDDEEIKMVTQILHQNSSDRETTIRELVWGLLASSEFRFFM